MNDLIAIYKRIQKPISLKNGFFLKLLKNSKYSLTLLKMRNNPINIKYSISQKKINLSTHELWIKNFIKNKNFFFLILKHKEIIGYIRLDKNKNELIISIFIIDKFRKKNLGSICLKYIIKIFNKFNLVAYVLKKNKNSLLFFKKNKFNISSKKRKLMII